MKKIISKDEQYVVFISHILNRKKNFFLARKMDIGKNDNTCQG